MAAAANIKKDLMNIRSFHIPAGMAELADARDLKSRSPKGSAGSTPAAGIYRKGINSLMLFFYYL